MDLLQARSCCPATQFRLRVQIVGDGFCEDAALRRRALDLTFSGLMQEAAEQERSRARLHKLSSTGPSVSSSSANGALAIVAAHQLPPSAAAAGSGAGSGAGRISEPGAKGKAQQQGFGVSATGRDDRKACSSRAALQDQSFRSSLQQRWQALVATTAGHTMVQQQKSALYTMADRALGLNGSAYDSDLLL